MEFSSEVIGGWAAAHLLPLFRIASFLMVVPVIGTQLVPMRVRLGLALLITLLVVPLIDPVPEIDAISLSAIPFILQQVLIGTAMGFMMVMLVQLFVVAGQMIAMQMGLGFASMVDPTNGVSVPVLSQIFLVTVTLLFLAMNGHLVMIEVFVESFYSWPISGDFISSSTLSPDIIWEMTHRISWLFAAALLMALPAVTSVLIVNVSFGIMTRAAPQMNIFSLGFPIGLLFGLFIVWVSMSGFLPQYQKLSEETFHFLRAIQGI